MATFCMIYVRHPDDDAIAQALASGFPGLSTGIARMADNPWAQLRDIEWDELAIVGGQLAAALDCAVVTFASQTTVGALELHVFEAGAMRRHLEYVAGGEGWMCVEGERQAWEDVLFAAEPDVDPEELDAASQRALETRTPVVGAHYPFVGSGGTFAIGDAIGLPGFSDRDGWSQELRVGAPALRRGETNWRVLGLVGLLVLCLILDGIFLPRSSWLSTGIFVVQLAVLLPLISRASAR